MVRTDNEIAARILGRPVDEVQVVPVRPTYGDFASQEMIVQVRTDSGWGTILTAPARDVFEKLKRQCRQGNVVNV